ncbi:MAG: hypothetical protein JRE24_07220 [Deltaproteobacteria bacterium]|nr:hypothetical protein [Deltaproteobacteria bacterium]
MSKAAQARPPRLSARDGGQGFSSRRTRWYSADGHPRRTPLIVKRAIYEWKLAEKWLELTRRPGLILGVWIRFCLFFLRLRGL